MEDTLSIALLKDVLAEIPADEQTHVTQMVEALDDNDMSPACLFLHERFQVQGSGTVHLPPVYRKGT